MRTLVFSLVIVSLIVAIFSIVGNSYGDEKYEELTIETKGSQEDNKELNAQKIVHDDFIDASVKSGKVITDKAFTQEWNYTGFTRPWNHTMQNHMNQTFNGPIHNWWTGLTLYRIGEIDTVAGTYDMTFNYWVQIFEKNDIANFTAKPPRPDFVNRVEVEQPVTEKTKGIIQTNHYYDIMVSETFYADMDFKKFPFERLDLSVIVEPSYDVVPLGDPFGYPSGSRNDTIQFHRWPFTALKPEGPPPEFKIGVYDVPSPGYEIGGYNITVDDHTYSEGDTYSRYEATFEVQRMVLGSFLKFIFPIIVMTSLAMSALVYPSDEYLTKIELNAIFLIGIIFFVQVVSEEIPSTGEMTIFDIVNVMSYAIIIVTISIPAWKWKKRRAYELNMKKRERWEDMKKKEKDINQKNIIAVFGFGSKDIKSHEEKKINEEIDKIEEVLNRPDGLEFWRLRRTYNKLNWIAWGMITAIVGISLYAISSYYF